MTGISRTRWAAPLALGGDIVNYYRRTASMVISGRPPRSTDEFLTWALVAPLRLWNQEVRHEGHSFSDYYLGHLRAVPAQGVLTNRVAYGAVLVSYPLVTGALSVGSQDFWTQWRRGMKRPDLRIRYPRRRLSQADLTSVRPDLAMAVYYAHEWASHQSPHQRLDDKNTFIAACQDAGFPTPRTYPLHEVPADGTFIVKDPREDQGRGVRLLATEQIAELPSDVAWQIQERLSNHSQLKPLLPEDGPLSTLRMITNSDGQSAQAVTAGIRMGSSGDVVDHPVDGRFMVARVDMGTGTLDLAEIRSPENYEIEIVDRHPEVGVPFVGQPVPYFDEIRRLCEAAHITLAPDAPTIGWDVAVTDDGPRLVELNFAAGSVLGDPDTDRFTPLVEQVVQRLSHGPGISGCLV